jgi:hypothetical protein
MYTVADTGLKSSDSIYDPVYLPSLFDMDRIICRGMGYQCDIH